MARKNKQQPEVSNKSLATLLILTMVISLAGTLVMINKAPFIVGAANTGTADVNLTVGSNVAITVSGNIDFGSGYANLGDTCTMESNGSYSAECQDGWALFSAQYITIKNDGNVNVSLDATADAAATSWLSSATATAQIRGDQNGNNGCDTGSLGAYGTLGTGGHTICSDLFHDKTSNLADTVSAVVKVAVPADATIGSKGTTVTFTATSSE